jgi:hypothetical protein
MLMVACLEMTSWDRAWSVERSRVESMLGNKRYIYCMEDDKKRKKTEKRARNKIKRGEENSIVYATV